MMLERWKSSCSSCSLAPSSCVANSAAAPLPFTALANGSQFVYLLDRTRKQCIVCGGQSLVVASYIDDTGPSKVNIAPYNSVLVLALKEQHHGCPCISVVHATAYI